MAKRRHTTPEKPHELDSQSTSTVGMEKGSVFTWRSFSRQSGMRSVVSSVQGRSRYHENMSLIDAQILIARYRRVPLSEITYNDPGVVYLQDKPPIRIRRHLNSSQVNGNENHIVWDILMANLYTPSSIDHPPITRRHSFSRPTSRRPLKKSPPSKLDLSVRHGGGSSRIISSLGSLPVTRINSPLSLRDPLSRSLRKRKMIDDEEEKKEIPLEHIQTSDPVPISRDQGGIQKIPIRHENRVMRLVNEEDEEEKEEKKELSDESIGILKEQHPLSGIPRPGHDGTPQGATLGHLSAHGSANATPAGVTPREKGGGGSSGTGTGTITPVNFRASAISFGIPTPLMMTPLGGVNEGIELRLIGSGSSGSVSRLSQSQPTPNDRLARVELIKGKIKALNRHPDGSQGDSSDLADLRARVNEFPDPHPLGGGGRRGGGGGGGGGTREMNRISQLSSLGDVGDVDRDVSALGHLQTPIKHPKHREETVLIDREVTQSYEAGITYIPSLTYARAGVGRAEYKKRKAEIRLMFGADTTTSTGSKSGSRSGSGNGNGIGIGIGNWKKERMKRPRLDPIASGPGDWTPDHGSPMEMEEEKTKWGEDTLGDGNGGVVCMYPGVKTFFDDSLGTGPPSAPPSQLIGVGRGRSMLEPSQQEPSRSTASSNGMMNVNGDPDGVSGIGGTFTTTESEDRLLQNPSTLTHSTHSTSVVIEPMATVVSQAS